jgi:hypothetical protein
MILAISSLVVPTGGGVPLDCAGCPALAGRATARQIAIATAKSLCDAFRRPMSLLPFCQWLAGTPGSIALHESLFMYPLIESVHVLTLCLFVGMTFVLDLRLTGLALKSVSVIEVVSHLRPWMFLGFFIMVVSGVLLFYAIPVRSYQNIFFRVKAVFLVLAGLNALWFETGIFRTVDRWAPDARPPQRARVAGAASLILWAGVIVTGRMIAYNWFDCDKPQPQWVQIATGCSYDAQR